MNKMLTTGLMIVIAATATAVSAQEREPRPAPATVPTLTVTGSGEVFAAPDEATVRLGVTRQASTAAAAQEQVNRTAEAIQAAVARMNVPRERVQTSQLTLFPVFAPQRPEAVEEPRIVAYRASNIITVRLTNLTQAGSVIDAGLKAGANQLDSLQFGLRNDREARQKALVEAIEDARAKARTMATALEASLVRVVEVQEGGFITRPPVFAEAAMAMRRGDAGTPVSPGEVNISATVTIRYQIRERQP